MTLGERLKDLRERNGLSVKKVSEDLNLSSNAYSHYEKDRNEPNIETICNLADYYHVSIDSLIRINSGKALTYAQNEIDALFDKELLNRIENSIDDIEIPLDLYLDWYALKNELYIIGGFDKNSSSNLTKQQIEYITKRIKEIIDANLPTESKE